MENIFIEKDTTSELTTKAEAVFTETPDAPFVEINGIIIPNRIFFDD